MDFERGYCTNPKRGEIYWIQRPPSATTIENQNRPGRPGVVVSNDSINSSSNLVEVVYLSQNQVEDRPEHCLIRSTGSRSWAVCNQVSTVKKENVGNYIATCTESEMNNLEACMAISLGLSAFNPELFNVQPEDLDGPKVIEDHDDEERILLEKKLSSLTETLDQLTAQLIESKAREKLLRELYDSLVRSKTE